MTPLQKSFAELVGILLGRRWFNTQHHDTQCRSPESRTIHKANPKTRGNIVRRKKEG